MERDAFGFEPFRERVPLSSMDLRPGEYLASRDVSRRLSNCTSMLVRRGLFLCSAEGVDGDGAPSSLPEFLDVELERDATDCWGDPRLRDFGVETPVFCPGVLSVRLAVAATPPLLRESEDGWEGGEPRAFGVNALLR